MWSKICVQKLMGFVFNRSNGEAWFRPTGLAPRQPPPRLTGYGQTGALVKRAGHDINYLAISDKCASSGGGSVKEEWGRKEGD